MCMLLMLCVEFEEKLNDIERKHRIGSEQLNVLLQYKVCHIGIDHSQYIIANLDCATIQITLSNRMSKLEK